MVKITDTKTCYFCGEEEVLQKHHIVPKEYNGSNREENLVIVCPNCHRKLHDLYNRRFYTKLTSLGLPESEKPENRPTGGRISNALSAARLQVCLALKWERELSNDEENVENMKKAHKHLAKVVGRY